jgi:hypothetical protein
MPYAFREAGVGLGTLILIFIAVITDYSLILMVRGGQLSGTNSYQVIYYFFCLWSTTNKNNKYRKFREREYGNFRLFVLKVPALKRRLVFFKELNGFQIDGFIMNHMSVMKN